MDEVCGKNSLSCGKLKREVKRTCAVCGCEFNPKGEHVGRVAKYCSKKCWSVRGEYRKIKCMNCGQQIPIRAKKFCSRQCAFEHRKGENHHAWKGAEASYSAVHKWMINQFGAPTKCFNCKGTAPRVEWANVSGKYLRIRSDWIELCSSCHRYFDKNEKWHNVILSRWEDYSGKEAKLDGETQ